MNDFDFNNRTAIITGGAQGFGLDVAKRFLQSGAKVFIWDVDEDLLKKVVNEINNPNLTYNK
ncbi:MAG: SDR family NAD(P)-dependent oxidoreductase, partial [Pelagibacteraceae bacterium]